MSHTREGRRLINRRQQGDLGEASAIEWLTRQGATVWTPLGHSPDADLVAELERSLSRIQVKTSTYATETLEGEQRWTVGVATNGGNQSWSGVAKKLDPSRFDFLFVLVGDGRRWLIPAPAIEAQTALTLGGRVYAEFEIEAVRPIADLVYGNESVDSKLGDTHRGSSGDGEPGAAVNRMPRAEWVRIPPPPSGVSSQLALPSAATERPFPTKFERTRISSCHQVTIPSVAFREAGLNVGDRLRGWADGAGRVVLERMD
jgi:PD-(D/E)XK endonuclease